MGNLNETAARLMPYPAKAVANAILNKAAEFSAPISPLKLQKLLYYVCGYYLAATGEPAIDRAFEAWENGPVVPEIYHEFKSSRWSPIARLANDYDGSVFKTVPIPVDDRVLNKVIDFVWDIYSKYTPEQLSDMTHAEGSPWDITRKKYPGIRDADISNDEIKRHFLPFIKRKDDV